MGRALYCIAGAFALASALAIAPGARAQNVVLDRQVRAGELTLFPSLRDEKVFYYAPSRPRLAVENGKPQFSFLRYVENSRGESGADAAREGAGGGIVHALVTLSVSDAQLERARQDLERQLPGARIEGPVGYSSGTFGLVSSFADKEGEFTRSVVGLGKAPLLDNSKAAVSIHLTKLGAKVLWESFHTPTPDISFQFEMELEGYRSPVQAVIEADFDRVYEHEGFEAALSGELGGIMLAGEINKTMEDLYESKVIKLTQIGEDAKLEELIQTAYRKLIEIMFQPPNESLAQLAGAAGQRQSMLDRASSALNQRRPEVERQNRESEQRDDERRRQQAQTTSTPSQPQAAPQSAPQAQSPPPRTGGGGADTRPREVADSTPGGGSPAQGNPGGGGAPRREEPRPATPGNAGAPTTSPDRQAQQTAPGATGMAGSSAREPAPAARPDRAVPMLSIAASYQMKEVRQKGKFRIDLNKYTTDRRSFPFSENIGDLREYTSDPDFFRSVNLDDPFYRQREIAVFVDGLDGSAFADYINFVSVLLRKRHDGGQETLEEVRVDRENFASKANDFRMVYGWKDDASRESWLAYEYKPTWSFHGGREVESEWVPATAGAIPLAPPYRPRKVTLDADPELIKAAGVRAITVKLFYELAGVEQTTQTTLNAMRGELSGSMAFMLPAGSEAFDYEITWRLRGNKQVSSGRQHATGSLLFVDELPEDAG